MTAQVVGGFDSHILRNFWYNCNVTKNMKDGITELPQEYLERDPFNQTRDRIEKCKRIGNDLRPSKGNPYDVRRVGEIRGIEAKSRQGEAGKESGFQEIVIDTRGYQEKRFSMTYFSPHRHSVAEELVMFVKTGKNGQPEWLILDGQPLSLNADLYDSRMLSHRHAQGIDYETKMIPKVDGRGAYIGIVSIIEAVSSK